MLAAQAVPRVQFLLTEERDGAQAGEFVRGRLRKVHPRFLRRPIEKLDDCGE
jgi:hypothetical protein